MRHTDWSAPSDPISRFVAAGRLVLFALAALPATGCFLFGPDKNGQGDAEGPIVWRRTLFLKTEEMVTTGDGVIVGARDGRLLRLDRETGAVRWATQLGEDFWGERLVRHGDLVFAAPWNLFAVDIATGEIRWWYLGTGGWGVKHPTLADGALYTPTRLGGLARLDAVTGALRWDVDLGEAVFPAAVGDDLVVVGTRGYADTNPPVGPLGAGRVVALSREKGSLVWEADMPDSAGFAGGVTMRPLVIGDMVVVGTHTSRVVGLRLADGARMWDLSTGASPVVAPYLSGAVFGGLAILLRGDGLVEAFDPQSGTRQWTLGSTKGSVSSTPFVLRDRLYVVLETQLWVVNRLGEVEWRYGSRSLSDTRPKFAAGPTVDEGGYAYAWVVDTQEGEMIAVRLPFDP